MNNFVAKRNTTNNKKMGVLSSGYNDTEIITDSMNGCSPSNSDAGMMVVKYSNDSGTMFGVYRKNTQQQELVSTSIPSSDSSSDSLLDKSKLSFSSVSSSSSSDASEGEDNEKKTKVQKTVRHTNIVFLDRTAPNNKLKNIRPSQRASPEKTKTRAHARFADELLSQRANIGLQIKEEVKRKTVTSIPVSPRAGYSSQLSLSSSINSISSNSSRSNDATRIQHNSQLFKSRQERPLFLQPMKSLCSPRPATIPSIKPSTEKSKDRPLRTGHLNDTISSSLRLSKQSINRSKSVRETSRSHQSLRSRHTNGGVPLLNTQPRNKAKTDEILPLSSRAEDFTSRKDELLRPPTEDILSIINLDLKPHRSKLPRPTSLLHLNKVELAKLKNDELLKHKSKARSLDSQPTIHIPWVDDICNDDTSSMNSLSSYHKPITDIRTITPSSTLDQRSISDNKSTSDQRSASDRSGSDNRSISTSSKTTSVRLRK